MSKKPLPNPAIEAIRGRGPLSHSALYWWMWDHFDDIDLARTGRPDWVTATQEFSRMGFKGREDAPLNKENVRKTWTRVVKDRKKLAASPTPVHPSAPPATSPVRMLPVTPVIPTPAKPDDLSMTETDKKVEALRNSMRQATSYGKKDE